MKRRTYVSDTCEGHERAHDGTLQKSLSLRRHLLLVSSSLALVWLCMRTNRAYGLWVGLKYHKREQFV